jgi:hypothetical protein
MANRGVLQILKFPRELVPFVNWTEVENRRKSNVCSLLVVTDSNGTMTLTFYRPMDTEAQKFISSRASAALPYPEGVSK